MKYKLIGVCALLLCGVAVLCATLRQSRLDTHARVHQHLAAAEKLPCERDHAGGELCSHLPLLSIDTGGQPMPGLVTGQNNMFGEHIYTTAADGDSMITAHLDVIDHEETRNHPTDAPTLTSDVRIRVRGHSSRQFEKAPYLIKLVNEDGTERDEALLGMSEHNEWALHGPYLDKSLLRNYVFYNLSGEIMDYAPNCRFCELILDGDYRGVYLLVETITAAEDGRLPIFLKEKNALMSGYLLRIDRHDESDLGSVRDVDTFSERTYTQRLDVSVRYPGKHRLTPELSQRIERDFSAFEKALYSFDYDEGDYSYHRYLDVDSFVDYYIINAVSANMDAGRFSTFLYKTLGGKYKLCVWDFNNCCDNYVERPCGEDFDGIRGSAYFSMLFRDRDFVERVIERYRALRGTVLSDAYLAQYIDDTLAYLGDAADRDSARWAAYIASDPLKDPEQTGRNPHSRAEAVEQLKGYLSERLAWMDENIDHLRQFCAGSANKRYSELPQ